MHIKQNQQACNNPPDELESKIRINYQPEHEESNSNICKPDSLFYSRVVRSPGFFFIQVTFPEVTPFPFHQEIKPQDQDINNYAPEKLADIEGIKENSREKDTHKQEVHFFSFSNFGNLDFILPPDSLYLFLSLFLYLHYLPFPKHPF